VNRLERWRQVTYVRTTRIGKGDMTANSASMAAEASDRALGHDRKVALQRTAE